MIALGPEVSIDLKVGQKAFVHDGFEFERVKLPEIWEGLKDTAPFSDLKAFVEAVDGDVEVEIIPEGSVLAVED